MVKTGRRLSDSLAKKTQISVVVTVFNESITIAKLIDALLGQSQKPDEIIIVDGGSTDDTYGILVSLSKKIKNLKVFLQKGNRSTGRNYGVSKSNGNIIAFTDAGCLPESNWLEELTKPFTNPDVTVVSGYYKGIPKNIFQKCLIPYVLVMPDKLKNIEFFPATRSMALRKTVWNKSGGFDPKLWHNEDYAFAHWLKKLGFKFTFAPRAVVDWFPRNNLKEAAWMFMRFAIGDIQSDIFRPKVKALLIRYLIFAFLIMITVEVRAFIYYLVGLMFLYLFWSIIKNIRYVKHLGAIFWLPIIQITADVSVIVGTIIGFLLKAYGLS